METPPSEPLPRDTTKPTNNSGPNILLIGCLIPFVGIFAIFLWLMSAQLQLWLSDSLSSLVPIQLQPEESKPQEETVKSPSPVSSPTDDLKPGESRVIYDYTQQGPPPEFVPLELKGYDWYKDSEYTIAEGEVKNRSDERIENLMAVVSVYDKNGNFITSKDSLIEYNPLLAGQTSPFKVYVRWNPEMHRAKVEFKTFNGTVISHQEVGN